MVGIFIATALLVASETEDVVDSNMNLRRKRTPRASQHYVGWRAWQKSLLLPVAGEFFPLTLPFIERAYGFFFAINTCMTLTVAMCEVT